MLEEMCCWWGSGDCDSDGLLELLGIRRRTEKSVYGRRCVEVGDVFGLEELPDQGVVDFAETVMRASDGCYSPGECYGSC